MLIRFFQHLREHRVPVSLRELLDLLAALQARLVFASAEDFYFVSRLCLVKDEKYYDRFDVAFDSFFSGLEEWQGLFDRQRPNQTARQQLLALAKREPQHLNALMAEYDKAIALYREPGSEESGEGADDSDEARPPEEWSPGKYERTRGWEENEKRKGEGQDDGEGDGDGNGEGEGKGNDGDEGQGEEGEKGEKGEAGQEGEGKDGETGTGSGDVKGQGTRDESNQPRQQSATKIWQMREYADYDPEVELGTRSMKIALRRLRKFARTGADLELDLDGTIKATARNGGLLDIREVPERHNAVKVLLFLDVGGSMDEHIERCAQLFSAARSEFKFLDYYYFHNFIYESVWHSNDRRIDDRLATMDVLHRFGSDYKIVIVGDGSMARHEIAEKGGSVEHYNAEPGEIWLERITSRFKKVIWLNPVDPDRWDDIYTIAMIRRLMSDHMYHLSVDGLEQAMKFLTR